MSEPTLPEKVVAIDGALDGAKVPHAFGGALALAYYAEPRATIDVDVNVFTAPDRHAGVLSALAPLGVEAPEDSAAEIERDGQSRWWWGRTPVDLFFAYDELHRAMREALHRVPFGDGQIPIISPEHLLVCKALFDRAKDWIDIEQTLAATAVDPAEVRRWLERALGPGDERLERFRELAD